MATSAWTIRRRLRVAAALTLLGVGVTALLGCFEIPATRAMQTNGRLRPEHLVGKDADDPIVIGQTKLPEALVALEHSVYGVRTSAGEFGPPMTFAPQPFEWELSPDGRHAAVEYQLRTGTEVWPLCFAAGSVGASRKLILDLDESGTVIGTRSAAYEDDAYSVGEPVNSESQRSIRSLAPEVRQRLLDLRLVPTHRSPQPSTTTDPT